MWAELFIGVDAGGTKTIARAVLGDRATHVTARAGAANPRRIGVGAATAAIVSAVEEVSRRLDTAPRLVACGVAGTGDETVRAALVRALSDALAAPVAVVTDVEAALAATARRGPAAVLISGTGSIALSRDAAGRVRRAGGLAPAGGDPGSGPWIAASAAGFERAEDVDDAAGRDPSCRRVLVAAAGSLVALVHAVTEDDFAGPLGLVGGVLEGSEIVRDEVTALLGMTRGLLRPGVPEVSPEVGAVRAARNRE